MNISLHENNWTVYVHEDIRSLTPDQVHRVIRLVCENMVVVFRNQSLTPEDELHFCALAGEYQHYPADAERLRHIRVNDGILRVTGQRNEHGEEGLFGHTSALDWHANQPSNPQRSPLIWLYGVEGTRGSRTSWINNILSYGELAPELQAQIQDIRVFCGYKSGAYSTSTFFTEHVDRENPVSLVQTNAAGKTGLFFPFLQIFEFENKSSTEFDSVMRQLREHVLQPRYAYDHDWQDGDVVISEQWLSIHKRWAFEHMSTRVLHRIAFDHSRVYTV